MTDADAQDHLAMAVARSAAIGDPSLPLDVGYRLAVTCLAELRADPTATPAALARAVLTRHPETDVSWANHVAHATVLLASGR